MDLFNFSKNLWPQRGFLGLAWDHSAVTHLVFWESAEAGGLGPIHPCLHVVGLVCAEGLIVRGRKKVFIKIKAQLSITGSMNGHLTCFSKCLLPNLSLLSRTGKCSIHSTALVFFSSVAIVWVLAMQRLPGFWVWILKLKCSIFMGTVLMVSKALFSRHVFFKLECLFTLF